MKLQVLKLKENLSTAKFRAHTMDQMENIGTIQHGRPNLEEQKQN